MVYQMEENKKVCKKCLVEKVRNLSGKFDSYNKRYDDENGKAWRGFVCPDCHKVDIKNRMQAMRVLRKTLSDIQE